ncbi:DNA-3-methyladenine glycosylase 2 family protein [Brevibacterium album]|uniref:DNA-3-methyladenine glycosylase 2 family protein n=1 Tax=Brevibacterium album TaxID=417948 RepID=UPI00048F84BD|nr:Ada metal-binding domain-containing protein [Brevibacterium album]
MSTRGSTAAHEADRVFAERYRAIAARDRRFDGQFFTAVHTTGIYCRPSCPARTPRPENVSFHLTSASAHEAGFRACKRCLPEAAPGTPAWNLRGDAAGRAMRLIQDGELDRAGVPGLAARLGYSPRHLSRILTSELGAGPLALARAHRAQTARALLVGTDLPLAQIAYAAGFGSVRQFNDTMREVFDAAPSELRGRARTRRGAAAAEPQLAAASIRETPGTVLVRVELPVRAPFDARGVFDFLARRAVVGVEHAESPAPGTLRYARTLSLPHGPGAARLTAAAPADSPAHAGADARASGSWRVHAELELSDLADLPPALARLRRLLDLDADPEAVDAALAQDPALAPLTAAVPGIRVPGAVDPHELVFRAMVGQQISVEAARTHLGRLAEAAGSPYSSRFAGLTRLFPDAAAVLAAVDAPAETAPLDPSRPLRLPRRALTAIRTAAQALDDGTLAVHPGAESCTLRKALTELPGIGSWTAAYIAMRVLGEPDAWLPGDAALLNAARGLGLLGPADDRPRAQAHRALTASAEAWAPWRSYAVMHLWQAAGEPAAAPRTPPTPEGHRS